MCYEILGWFLETFSYSRHDAAKGLEKEYFFSWKSGIYDIGPTTCWLIFSGLFSTNPKHPPRPEQSAALSTLQQCI